MSASLPFVIGHRGARGLAPENTAVGFRVAKTTGVRWVEFDVKLSKDGIALLMHDDLLDRTTSGRGRVMDRMWSELSGLDAGSRFSSDFKGEPIPRFDRIIPLLGELGLGANVEIKPSPGTELATAAEVIAIIRRHWPAGLPRPLLTSFSDKAIVEAHRLAPDLPKALLSETLPDDWQGRAKAIGAGALHLDNAHLKESDVKAIRGQGLDVRVYTVNDPARAQELLSWGVGSVFTDYPNLISVEK